MITSIETPICMQLSIIKESRLGHRRYGHLNYKILTTLQLKNIVGGLSVLNEVRSTCTSCLMDMIHREVISKKNGVLRRSCSWYLQIYMVHSLHLLTSKKDIWWLLVMITVGMYGFIFWKKNLNLLYFLRNIRFKLEKKK